MELWALASPKSTRQAGNASEVDLEELSLKSIGQASRLETQPAVLKQNFFFWKPQFGLLKPSHCLDEALPHDGG